MALEVAAIVAERLSRPGAEVGAIQIEIMRADAWPRDHAEQLATLVLALLFGAKPDTAAATTAAMAKLRDDDGVTAVQFVAGLVRALMTLDDSNGFPPALAYRSTVYAELGDAMAVRCQFTCDDGLEVVAFSGDADGYMPDRDTSVSLSMGLPGRILFRMARDLLEVTE